MEYPIFDTHAHYSARAFDADRFALLDSLPGKGVVGVCEQATHSGDAPKVLELAHKYPWVYAAVGIHPESLLAPEDCGEEGPAPTVSVYGGDWAAEMRALAPYYEDPKVVAVGECGLDYHWPVPKDAQLALFEAEIRLALELDKPIIVHDRSAHADVYALLKKYRPKGTSGELFSLLGLCGISTFIMGALTGGFFGDFLTQLVAIVSPGTVFALPKLFDPLDDLTMILIGSMALGMVQIVTGMAISLIEKCKRKKFLDAFFEEITWWTVFIGIALLALGKGAAVLYVGCALVLLGPIVQGKGWGKLTGVFGSLYNHVTGYFGDILSYTRLMALMLAGSVIAQVFNMLAAMPGNVIAFIIISTLGNAMNFGLNLLGCYVHDLRLQCLEFFNKFYVDGGKPFRPMTLDTEYVDLQ